MKKSKKLGAEPFKGQSEFTDWTVSQVRRSREIPGGCYIWSLLFFDDASEGEYVATRMEFKRKYKK